jgi:hypothetical protein
MKSLKKWRLLILAVVMAIVMLIPAKADAFSVNINFWQQAGGAAGGELWLGGELFWRVVILSDGAKEAAKRVTPARTTYLVPAIVDGMFVINMK